MGERRARRDLAARQYAIKDQRHLPRCKVIGGLHPPDPSAEARNTVCSIFDVPASWTAAFSTKVSLLQVRLGRVSEQAESPDDPMSSVSAFTTTELHNLRRVLVGVDEERWAS